MATLNDLKLVREVLGELTSVLQDDAEFSASKLADFVKDAYRQVKTCRRYEYTSMNEQQIEQDMYDNYFGIVKKLAKYYYVKDGGDFQTSHSENGISRSWEHENDILSCVIPFVKLM